MAKLYWRVKRDGKWTWVAATERNTMDDDGWFPLLTYKEEAHHQPVMEDAHHQPVMEEEA